MKTNQLIILWYREQIKHVQDSLTPEDYTHKLKCLNEIISICGLAEYYYHLTEALNNNNIKNYNTTKKNSHTNFEN